MALNARRADSGGRAFILLCPSGNFSLLEGFSEPRELGPVTIRRIALFPSIIQIIPAAIIKPAFFQENNDVGESVFYEKSFFGAGLGSPAGDRAAREGPLHRRSEASRPSRREKWSPTPLPPLRAEGLIWDR